MARTLTLKADMCVHRVHNESCVELCVHSEMCSLRGGRSATDEMLAPSLNMSEAPTPMWNYPHGWGGPHNRETIPYESEHETAESQHEAAHHRKDNVKPYHRWITLFSISFSLTSQPTTSLAKRNSFDFHFTSQDDVKPFYCWFGFYFIPFQFSIFQPSSLGDKNWVNLFNWTPRWCKTVTPHALFRERECNFSI